MRLTAHTRLAFLGCRDDARPHELATHRRLARSLAELLGCRYDGDFEPRAGDRSPCYFVPNDTIVGIGLARRYGIRGEGDLFGGVVPFPFVASKAITHALVGPDAAAPRGWNERFAERVRHVVLPGHTAFARADARIAARRLLREGPVRIKPASGVGGAGQSLASNEREFEERMASIGDEAIERSGVVIERNLVEATTYSIGLLSLGALRVGYFGTQCTTRNRHGSEVYGGSTITAMRGGLAAVERAVCDEPSVRRAVAMARAYHEAALACFPGLLASRCNYDVVEGRDADGRPVSGVLEQSWRIGGASGAEVLALQALCREPSVASVCASTIEVHGAGVAVPEGATVLFRGVDDTLGPITKYARVHEHAGA